MTPEVSPPSPYAPRALLPLASSNPGHKSHPLAPSPPPPSYSQQLLHARTSSFKIPSTAVCLETGRIPRPHTRQVTLGDPQDPTQLQGQPRGPWDPRAPAHYSNTGVRDPSAPEL